MIQRKYHKAKLYNQSLVNDDDHVVVDVYFHVVVVPVRVVALFSFLFSIEDIKRICLDPCLLIDLW